jgi:hypothetical protein
LKTFKILAVIFTVLAAAFLALHIFFSPKTETASFEYRDMPYNLVTWRLSDHEGNNPVMYYCLLEEADNENMTFTILQDWSETGQVYPLEIKLKANLKQGMLESFSMKNIMDVDSGLTSDIYWNSDFSTNRLTLTYYRNNNRDGREEPGFNVWRIREKPTWVSATVFLADMVVLLPYINTETSIFTASFFNMNNYTKLVFRRNAAADSSGRLSITYKFSPYGIFGIFSSLGGEFTLINNGSFIELKQLSTTESAVGAWRDLLITVLDHRTITAESFGRIRETLAKGEKVNL